MKIMNIVKINSVKRRYEILRDENLLGVKYSFRANKSIMRQGKALWRLQGAVAFSRETFGNFENLEVAKRNYESDGENPVYVDTTMLAAG